MAKAKSPRNGKSHNTAASPNNGSTTDDFNHDAFVAKINPEGTGYVWSTYLGGTDWDDAFGIAIDSSANVYVTGGTGSEDFPLKNAFPRLEKGLSGPHLHAGTVAKNPEKIDVRHVPIRKRRHDDGYQLSARADHDRSRGKLPCSSRRFASR